MSRLYDDVNKRKIYKEDRFHHQKSIVDDYTGERVYKQQTSSRKHKNVADIDHIVPIKKVTVRYQNTNLTDEQIRLLSNRKSNLAVTKSSLNRSKGGSSNHQVIIKDVKKISCLIGEHRFVEATDATKALSNRAPQMIKKEIGAEVSLNLEATTMQIQNVSQEAGIITNKILNTNEFKSIHDDGIKTGEGAVVVTSAISLTQNMYAVLSNEKTLDVAVKDISKDVIEAGVTGYAIGSTSSALQNMMTSSKSNFLNRCGNSVVPVAIVSSSIEIGKSFTRYAKNEIDEEGLVIELGEKGTGMLAASYGAAIGTVLGASVGSIIPVFGTTTGAMIGGFMGSMLGYSTSAMLYYGALQVFENEKISYKRRYEIEQIARYAIEMNEKYCSELDKYLDKCRSEYRENIGKQITCLNKYLQNQNEEEYVEALNKIGNYFGINLMFQSFIEFDQAMNDVDYVFVL